MTTTTSHVGLVAIKSPQQRAWASGDFSVIASRIVIVSERLAESADLRAGWRVLDVACGNATLAAARSGTHAIGMDFVPALLEDGRGRGRAVAEGLDVEFLLGDTQALPVESASVDAVLSVYGTTFAPDHQQTADEIVRVVRPTRSAPWNAPASPGSPHRRSSSHSSAGGTARW